MDLEVEHAQAETHAMLRERKAMHDFKIDYMQKEGGRGRSREDLMVHLTSMETNFDVEYAGILQRRKDMDWMRMETARLCDDAKDTGAPGGV